MRIERAYLPFYIDGRDDTFGAPEVDTTALATRFLVAGDIRQIAYAAAHEVAAKADTDGSEHRWAAKRTVRKEIHDAGGDARTAWKHYLQGLTEALATELEPMILEEASAIVLNDEETEDQDDEPPAETD